MSIRLRHQQVCVGIFFLTWAFSAPRPAIAQERPSWQAEVGGAASLILGSRDVLDGGLQVDLIGGRRLVGPLWADVGVSYTDLSAQTDESLGETADNALLGLTAGLRLWLGQRPFAGFVSLRAGPVGVLQDLSARSGAAIRRATRTDWGLAGLAAAGVRFGLGARAGILATASLGRTSEVEFVRTTGSGGSLTTDLTQLRLGLSLHLFLP